MMKSHSFPTFRYSHFFVFIILAVIFFSCSSTNKMISQGNYDDAITLLTEKLSKRLTSGNISQLDHAYNLANSNDFDTIKNLKLSGQPDIWHKVFDLYTGMQMRQQKVEKLPLEVLNQVGYVNINYDNDIQISRQKAAEYYYALAKKQLEKPNGDNHVSYGYLKAIQEIYPGFRDVEKLIVKLKMAEPLYIYYHIENDYPYTLPPGTSKSLKSIDLSIFNTSRYRFLNKKPPTDQYKVFVQLTITGVKISPEKTGELSYTESVEMQDGIAYELDENGDFVLDSLGRKIQIPKLKTLVCYVTEFKQEKMMMLIGKIEVIDRKTGQTIGMKTIKGESKFINLYANFKGDMDALSRETFELVGTNERDFPDDAAMIIHAGNRLGEDAVKKVTEVLDNVEL